MKCPVCGKKGATLVRSRELLDAVDLSCPACGSHLLSGQERELDLPELSAPERKKLARELRAASKAGVQLRLTHGFSRRIVETGWRVAPVRTASSA